MEEKRQSRPFFETNKYGFTGSNLINNNNRLNDSNNEGRKTTEKNIRNKLENAFSDLESLRSALKNIKYKNDSSLAGNSKRISNYENNNWENKSKIITMQNDNNYLNNNSLNDDYRNGGSRSRSNSKNKSLNYHYNFNQKSERNNYFRTPKASTKSNIDILFKINKRKKNSTFLINYIGSFNIFLIS